MKRPVEILIVLAVLLALAVPVAGQGNPKDSDDDGVPDDVEITQGTDPNKSDTNEDGVPDGATQSIRPDGSIMTTWADGLIIIEKPDDSLEAQYPSNYEDPELAGATVQTSADGTEITTWPPDHPDPELAGCTEIIQPDGTVTGIFPLGYLDPTLAGSKVTVAPDGTQQTTWLPDHPDPNLAGATMTVTPDGAQITAWPPNHPDPNLAGCTEISHADGTVILVFPPNHPDPLLAGTTVTQLPDGTEIQVALDGTVIQVAPDGTETQVAGPNVSPAEGAGPDSSTPSQPAQVSQATFADGTAVSLNPDGSFSFMGPDGKPRNCVCTTASPASSSPVAPWITVPPKLEKGGDVYDSSLMTLAQTSYASSADVAFSSLSAGQWGQPVGGVWPSYNASPFLTTQNWNVLNPSESFSYSPDGQVMGQGLGVFGAPDRSFVIDNSQWDAQFDDRGNVSFTTDQSGSFGFTDLYSSLAAPAPTNYSCNGQLGPFGFVTGGVNIAGAYNADSDTLTLTLVEGTLTLTEPAQAEFTGPNDGQTALALQIMLDGSIEQQTISLEEAQRVFPPAFRSLAFSIEMQDPVAANRQEAAQEWAVLFDVDGTMATGTRYTTDTDPGFASLGVDFMAWVHLLDDGTFGTEASFVNAPDQILPVDVVISPDRRTLTVYIATAEFVAQAEALGLLFAPETLRWRVSSITNGAEGPARDVYPDLFYNYDTGALDAVVTIELPPQPPDGTQFGYGHSVTNGGPAVSFEDHTVSGDPNIPVTGWLWDFGDGTTSTEQNPQHSYQNAGTYTVSVIYTFANGVTDTRSFEVEVTMGSGVPPAEASQAPSDSCTASATSGANLRGGPGTNYAQAGSVAGGDVLQVIGVNAAGDWYELQLDGIASAWIAAFLIAPPMCPDGFTLPVMNE